MQIIVFFMKDWANSFYLFLLQSFVWGWQKAFFILQALSQNAELRTRLNRIHSESVLTEQVVSVNIISTPDEVAHCLSLTNLIAYPDIDKATASDARQVVDVFASCIYQLDYWFSLL